MRALYLLVFVIQFTFAFHALKTGRGTRWIVIIFMAPVIGSLLYYFLEVFPNSREERTLRRRIHDIARALNPDAELKRRAAELLFELVELPFELVEPMEPDDDEDALSFAPYQVFTPLWPEQAPDLVAASVYVPSLHSPVALAGFSALSAAASDLADLLDFSDLSAFSDLAADLSSLAIHFFTPPWDEQAPSLLAEVV